MPKKPSITLKRENKFILISSNRWAILPYGFEYKSMNSNFIEINLAASIGFKQSFTQECKTVRTKIFFSKSVSKKKKPSQKIEFWWKCSLFNRRIWVNWSLLVPTRGRLIRFFHPWKNYGTKFEALKVDLFQQFVLKEFYDNYVNFVIGQKIAKFNFFI